MRILALIVALALAGGAVAAQEADDRPTITVTGEGRVEAAPDMATITLGVVARSKTAKEAMDEVSNGVDALLATLKAAGVEPRDIQTSGLNLNPMFDQRSYESGMPRITGFDAGNTVTVRVRAIDGLGQVLDAVLESGANSFNGLMFGLQDPQPTADEARRKAVEDARRKADLYAAAAGVSLGKLVSVSEVGQMGGGPQPMFRMEAAQASDGMAVAPGELTLTERVNVVWEIAP